MDIIDSENKKTVFSISKNGWKIKGHILIAHALSFEIMKSFYVLDIRDAHAPLWYFCVL